MCDQGQGHACTKCRGQHDQEADEVAQRVEGDPSPLGAQSPLGLQERAEQVHRELVGWDRHDGGETHQHLHHREHKGGTLKTVDATPHVAASEREAQHKR